MNTARQNWKSSARRHHGRITDGASKGAWIFDRTRGCCIYAPGFRGDFGTIVEFDYCFDDRGRPVALNVVSTLQPAFNSTQAKEWNDDQRT
jgi:hypothetical protein